MDQLEASGKTVDDALKAALAKLGTTIDQVQFVVLDEGKRGFLGRGGRDAVVRVERNPSAGRSAEPMDRGAVDTSIPRRPQQGGQGRRGGSGGAQAANRGPRPDRPDRPDREARPPRPEGQGAPRGRGRGGSRTDLDEPAPRLTDDAFLRPGGGGAPAEGRPPRASGPGEMRGPRPASGPGEMRSPRPPRERRNRREEEEPYVEPNIDAPAVDLACQTVDDILRLLDIRGDITIRAPETPGDGLGMALAVVDISGEDLGLLIGRRGDTLASLQYIVNLIVSRKFEGTHSAVTIDVEQYRKRRELQLIDLAARMADLVKRRGSPITLEPMTPAERRIIHVTLAEDPELETNSIGEGENRKVVISTRR